MNELQTPQVEIPPSEITKLARRVCPHWMCPTDYAHYMDVKRALETAYEMGVKTTTEQQTNLSK